MVKKTKSDIGKPQLKVSAKDLKNKKRELIYNYIKDNPGIRFIEVVRGLDTAISTTTYHLLVLEENKLIKSVRTGEKKYYFPKGYRYKKSDFMSKTSISILKLVQQLGHPNQNDIIQKSKIPQSTVSRHLLNLEKQGYLKRYLDGFTVRYKLAKKIPVQQG